MTRPLPIRADYVIVGAGSAGCVLASRLSEDPSTRVVLVEAGSADKHPMLHVPVGYAKTLGNPQFDWCYQTASEPGLDGRTLHYARGKVLGGSSSINGLMWVRGDREDYDRWRAQGCVGWGYDDLLPYMIRSESYAPGGPDRGLTGPVPVDINPGWHRSMRLTAETGIALGLPTLPDYNVAKPFGLGRVQLNWHRGRRKSSAATYLAEARRRPNLEIITNVSVDSLVIENGATTGVRVTCDGCSAEIAADREVILTAGAIGSPLLLEASGVGDPARLISRGIAVRASAPQVGENLQDHYYVMTQFNVRRLTSLNAETRGWRAARNAARYVLMRSGVLSQTPIQLTGFARSSTNTGAPDLQMFACPMTYSFEKIDGKMTAVIAREPGMSIAFYQRRPYSRGHVHGVNDGVSLVCNFLTDRRDRQVVLGGLRLCRAFSSTAPLKDFIKGEVAPGPEISDSDDIALLNFAKRAGISGFHASGTCRMGSDEMSVVDPSLRARAVRRLRIADASIMPDIVGSNTHAPTVMIAERAADLILGRA